MRRKSGSSIIEGAAGLMVLLPVLIAITYVVLEASHAYLIWSSLQQGAQEAARNLATSYAMHPTVAVNLADQKTYGFDPVRINQVINDSNQFTATFNPNVGNPTSVTVTVTYYSGVYGLPKFPDADLLNLGANFQMSGTARYALE